ncbi:MAG: hypothetical protein AAF362_05085 [Pseudomonadota bacterium]
MLTDPPVRLVDDEDRGGCRYLLPSEANDGTHHWCGKQKREGSSYCQEHYDLCHSVIVGDNRKRAA